MFKFKNINQIKAGIILSYACIVFQCMINLVYTPIMLHFLGQQEYGIYSLSASIIGYLGLLNFGLGSAYVKFYSRYKTQNEFKKIEQLNGLYLTIFTVIAFIVFFAGMWMVKNCRLIMGDKITENELKLAQTLLFLLVVNLAIYMPGSVFSAIINVHERYLFQKGVDLIKTISSPFLTIPLLFYGFGSEGIVAVTLFLTVVSLVIHTWYCFKILKVKFSFGSYHKYFLGELIGFSFFIFLQLIMDQLNWQLDRFLLGRFKGSTAVAVYSVGAQFNGYLILLSSSICNVFTPRVHNLISKKREASVISQLFVQVSRLQFIIIIFVFSAFLFFGKPFIRLWVGYGYEESYYVSVLLMLPLIVALTQNLSIEILRAKNMHRFLNLLYIAICFINVVITIPLCQLYGAIGSALGTCITMMFAHLGIANIYYHKIANIDMKLYWKGVLSFIPALVLPFLSGMIVISKIRLNSWLQFLAVALLYILIFFCSMWFLGLKKYEKDLFLQPLLRVLLKLRRR